MTSGLSRTPVLFTSTLDIGFSVGDRWVEGVETVVGDLDSGVGLPFPGSSGSLRRFLPSWGPRVPRPFVTLTHVPPRVPLVVVL